MNLDFGVVSSVILFIVTVGIFARKEDIAALRAEMYQSFTSKAEFEAHLARVENKLDKLFDILSQTR